MSSPLKEFSRWQYRHLAAVAHKLGGPEVARKLLTCRNVTVNFSADGQQATIAAVTPTQKFLDEAKLVAVPDRSSTFDPHAFFQTREGCLYVWESYTNRILAAAKKTEALPAMEITSFDLIKNANDGEIRGELLKDHVFEDASEFCALLAGMIERQPNGKDGDLLNTGYVNIFYVRGVRGGVFTVSVYWSADRRGWGVSAGPLGGDRWFAGYRVFSRNCSPSVA